MTRTSYATAVLLALLMIGVPSFFVNDGSIGTSGNAAAATGIDVERNYIIAVAELTLDTLNPNTYTMVSEGMVIFPVYSYLLQYDVDLEIIGDAAKEWSRSADGLLWNFKLWDNIYFIDPASPDKLDHKLTGADVIYTFETLQANDASRLHFYFPGILEDMWTTPGDPYDLWIQLNTPFAPIMDSWLGMPILPKYYWEASGETFIDFENDPPIGSGPFYYNASNDPTGQSVKLSRNNHWYMTENFGWQVHTDQIVLKEEISEDGRLIALRNGDIDVMLRVSPSMYLDELPTYENVACFSFTGGFVYEFNLNQMTDELREELGWTAGHAYNNQLLLLEPVKKAFAMSVDKEAFVTEILEGLGAPACSLIPQGNTKWHWEVPDEDKIPFDTAGARAILNANGWVYNELGQYNPGATPLARKNVTTGLPEDVLSFRYYTLDTADLWEYGALAIAETCADAGIELNLEVKSVSVMNTLWYTGNYDVWLWDWVMGIIGDGSGIMEVLTSMSIGESSDVYWVNDTYDSIYNESLYCMDPVYRKELVDELQRMAYFDMACQCVAYSADNYGVSEKTWDPRSLGDWNSSYYLLPDIWYQWLAMQMYPNDNHAPYVQLYQPDVSTTINTVENFYTVGDDDGTNDLLYRWFWGDGTKTDWNSDGHASHSYERDGVYDVWVAIREDGPSLNNYNDNFTTVDKIVVTVRDYSNDIPRNLDFSYSPESPDTGDKVTFTGYATDEEGDELFYTWNFGGGHWLDGPEVEFQFMTEGYHSVEMYVTDDHLGSLERPVSTSQTVFLRKNYAPTIDVPTFTDVKTNTVQSFTVTASDPDDPIRLTWFWGDGSVSVTSTTTASHSYTTKGEYNLLVFADDMTGLPDHNVSDSNIVYVYNPAGNSKPVIQGFSVTDTTPYTYEVVSFTGNATDADGDALTLTIAFGDGKFAVESFPATDPNEFVTWTTTHAYTSAGTYTAQVYADDGDANISVQQMRITMVVALNRLPEVSIPEDHIYSSTGVSTEFTVSASDADGDTLQYYWEWDDGTYSATSTDTTTHTYAESGDYVYVVWVNDGHGHNVSDLGYAHINAIPSVTPLLDFSWEADLDCTFTAEADDADDDPLVYTWVFSDGVTMVGESVTRQFAVVQGYTCTVHVDDGFPLASHNVSDSCVVTVLASGSYPPEVQDLPERTETINEVVTFTAVASDPDNDPLVYEWDFGDGHSATGKTVTHAYTGLGDYTYSVDVCDGTFTTMKFATIHIVDDAAPVANAGADKTVDEDTSVTFVGAGSDDVGIADYEWTIPLLSVTLEDVNGVASYTFVDPGVYTVVLKVTDTIGQTDTDELTVTVRDITPPTAVAVATPSSVDMGGSVTLDGSGSDDNVPDNIVSWKWVFFDGVEIRTLYGETVSHVFEVAGEYTATLTVTDLAGKTGTDTVVVTVIDIEDPIADATATPNPVNFGDTVTLDGSGSTDNVGPVSWTWEISLDGVPEDTLTGMTVDYVFLDLGDYDITLTVADEAGNTDSVTIVVTSEDSETPVAVAVAEPTMVPVGGEVAFDASDSTDNHEISSYVWTFEYDGKTETLTGVSQSFEFGIEGVYEVTLTVEDASGNTATDTVTVTANAPPVADAGDDETIEAGTEYTFDGSGSSDDVDAYTWTFEYDDGTETITGVAPVFTFDIAGVYTVTLNVTDTEGLWDTDTVTITVTEESDDNVPPVADAGDDETIEAGTEYTFDGSGSSDSDGTIVSYRWTFTYDGETKNLTGDAPSFTFDIVGEYVVTLTVTDSDGDTGTDTVTITVVEEEDKSSFIEQYGLFIAAIVAIVAIALVAMMLMKRKKGGEGESSGGSGVEGIDSGQP